MYQKTLMEQWDNLCSDFAGEFEFLNKQEKATASFNRWYEARVHRWSSSSYAEGIILSQLQKQEFAEQLTNSMKRFRFSEVSPASIHTVWSGIPFGLLAGVICGGVLFLLDKGIFRSIISGIVVLAVVSGLFYKKNEAFNKNVQNDVKKAYVQQLKDHGKELLAICNQFNIN